MLKAFKLLTVTGMRVGRLGSMGGGGGRTPPFNVATIDLIKTKGVPEQDPVKSSVSKDQIMAPPRPLSITNWAFLAKEAESS